MTKEILDSDYQDPKKLSGLDAQSKANVNRIIIYLNISRKAVLLTRNLLVIMGVISLSGLLFNVTIFNEPIFYVFLIESIMIAGVYFGCAFSIKKYPKLVCIIALISFLLIQIYFHLIGFRLLWSFIIIKVPILYILIQGIRGAIKIEKDSEELIKYGVSYDEVNKIKNLQEISIIQ